MHGCHAQLTSVLAFMDCSWMLLLLHRSSISDEALDLEPEATFLAGLSASDRQHAQQDPHRCMLTRLDRERIMRVEAVSPVLPCTVLHAQRASMCGLHRGSATMQQRQSHNGPACESPRPLRMRAMAQPAWVAILCT